MNQIEKILQNKGVEMCTIYVSLLSKDFANKII